MRHTQTPRSVGATGAARRIPWETDEEDRVDQKPKMWRGNPGRFDRNEGLRTEKQVKSILGKSISFQEVIEGFSTKFMQACGYVLIPSHSIQGPEYGSFSKPR